MKFNYYIRWSLLLLITLHMAPGIYSMEDKDKEKIFTESFRQIQTKEDIDFVKGFQAIFQKKPSFYGISVSRKTIDDKDYPKLKPIECEIVFNALRFILGKSSSLPELLDDCLNTFIKNERGFLEDFEKIYEKKYQEINEHTLFELNNLDMNVVCQYVQAKKDFSYFFNAEPIKNALEQSSTIEEMRQKVGDYISSAKKEIAELLLANNKKVYLNKNNELKGDNFETQLLEYLSDESISNYFLKNVEKNFQSTDLDKFYDLTARFQKDPYFLSLRAQKDKNLYLLNQIREKIAGSNYLIIFNEMFFGKAHETKNSENYAPLLYKEFTEISSDIQNLSKMVPSAIFHVNFLYFSNQQKTGKEYKDLVQQSKKKLNPKGVKNYSFLDNSQINWNIFLNKIANEKNYDIFQNESLIYSCGRVVGSYQKASYKDEANLLLNSTLGGYGNSLYFFGEGIDKTLENSDSAKIINNYISTDICYDLEVGVRYELNNYPSDGKIHIFVSNTLPLSTNDTDSITKNRFNNLPNHIPLIFHIDPDAQDLFLNPPKGDFFLNEYFIQTKKVDMFQLNKINNVILQTPCFNPIQLGIGDNIFTFKIWDINAALDKL